MVQRKLCVVLDDAVLLSCGQSLVIAFGGADAGFSLL